MTLPRFHAQCDWCGSGDVTLYFDESVPHVLVEYVAEILAKKVKHWDNETRTIYHLEEYVKSIIRTLMRDNHLRRSPITKLWVWK